MEGFQKARLFFFFLCLALLGACSTSSQIDRGVAYYNKGKYDDAFIQWHYPAQQGNHIAQHNIGLIYRDGLGSTQKNLNESANWFYLSAQQGYSPSMVRLAEVQSMLGNEAPANTWLHLAARWGNNEAIQHLRRKGLDVPQPDLMYAQQQRDAQALQTLAAGMVMLNAMDAMNNATPTKKGGSGYSSSRTSSSTASSVNTAQTCISDYACGMGFKCVKSPYATEGQCLRAVNQHGLQQFNQPDPNSINIKTTGQCLFDTQCPIGFRCDQALKACVK